MKIDANALIIELIKHSVPLSKWGKGNAKTFKSLVNELEKEECGRYYDNFGRLARTIRVIFLDIYYRDPETQRVFYLVEKKQILKDGRTRIRRQICSIAEKLVGDEQANFKAVRRALREELDITTEVREMYQTNYDVCVGASVSYPGLQTRSYDTRFTVYLTDDQYKPEGYTVVEPDKTNYFVWKEL